MHLVVVSANNSAQSHQCVELPTNLDTFSLKNSCDPFALHLEFLFRFWLSQLTDAQSALVVKREVVYTVRVLEEARKCFDLEWETYIELICLR